MLETIFTTVVSSTLFITSAAFAPQASAPVAFTQVLPENNYVAYSVESDESLAAISEKYYGTDAYWTNIWNDNMFISDPENVTAGQRLRINHVKPEEPAELATVLSDRDAKLTEQKNETYLKSIGYLHSVPSVAATIPTVTPVITQAPVVNAIVASNNSGISEDAITALGACEAGNDPAKNTGNGYYGAFQFSAGTWNSMNTGYDRADLAPIEVQRAAVKQLLSRSSIHNQFPGCARKMQSQGVI